MAEVLLFLGAGSSAPFGIPTMKEMVKSFEEEMASSVQNLSDVEYQLYRSVKELLIEVYGYVDLEMVFGVIDGISRDMTIADLGSTIA